MAGSSLAPSSPSIPHEVHEFAAQHGVTRYLHSVIELARQAFPSCPLAVTLGADAEEETHRYIAMDVNVAGLTSDDVLAGQRLWSGGIARICPSRLAVYFVLGWR